MIRILLVDDESIIREGIETMIPYDSLNLSLTGSCTNAIEALESMADNMPDILVTDIRMPEMDGLELIEYARKLNSRLQCVILSAYDDFSYAQRAVKMGVREYLLKPFTKEELVSCLDRLCAEIRTQRMEQDNIRLARRKKLAAMEEALSSVKPMEETNEILPSQVERILADLGDEDCLREAYVRFLSRRDNIPDEGFQLVQKVYSGGSPLTSIIAEGLSQLYKARPAHGSFVDHMCRYIQEHYADENLSLQYLADHVIFMRADYIGRRFSQETGTKLSAYLLKIRMEKAKALLRTYTGEQRIYLVAENVGLGHNPQYFSQLFRKYTGFTPSEYMEQAVNNTVL